ncbi:unnamed protein product [Paramecium primaurelia]|uniref:Uncharacterized protein n=1 Tax=Paramecium primaurelia TaxID=5886 RepID=A0A8S1PSC1_PARPR|nr:unnamed protein product [Paramecium primaurelia]
MKGVYSPKQIGRFVSSNNENLQQIILITQQQLNNAIQASFKQKVLFRILEICQKIGNLVNKPISLKILNDLKAEIQILLEKDNKGSCERILLQRLQIELQNKIIIIQKRLLKCVVKHIKEEGENQVGIYHSQIFLKYDLLRQVKNQNQQGNLKSKTLE